MALSGKQIALLNKLAAAGEQGEWSGVDPRTVNALVKRYMVRADAHPSRSNLRLYRITPKGLSFLAAFSSSSEAQPATGTAQAAFNDTEPEAGGFQDGDKVVIRERADFVTSIPEISRYYLNRTIGTVVELYHDITASVSVVFEPGQIWHMRPDDLTLWTPEAGSGADNEIPADVAIELLEHQKRNAEYHMEGYRDALEKVRKALRLFQGDDFYVSMALGIIDGTLEDAPVGE